MADKTISELVAATSVGSTDLFVLEQSNTAKKLTGQILENWLVSFADGHGGIQSIAKTGTSGTNPVIDTYTITLADETTFSFTVTNGLKGDTGAQTYVWIKWAAQNPTADNQLSNNPDKWIGVYSGTASTAPTSRTAYQWYEYKGETGDTGATGASIASVTQTGGTGAPGTYDTYTITLDTGVVAGTFQVYNGLDGSGSVSSVNGQTGDVVLTASDVGVSASSSTPLTDSGSGVVGTSTAYAHGDHRHPLNVSGSTPSPLGTAAAGSSGQYARADHVHAMPTADEVGAMSAWELLWTNASPTSDFAAQTISLPSNDCDFYYIRTIRDKNATTDIISPIFLKVGEKGFVRFEAGSGGIQSGSIIAYSREVTMTSATQVDFAAGYIFGHSSATRNDLSIPYQIYGIKGVQ